MKLSEASVKLKKMKAGTAGSNTTSTLMSKQKKGPNAARGVPLKKVRKRKVSESILREHDDPSPYIDQWKDKGFSITYEELEGTLKFTILDQSGKTFVITEPETGQYVYQGQTFGSFNDAMQAAANADQTDADEHVFEKKEEIMTKEEVQESIRDMKKLAGIKDKPKQVLKENFSAIPNTIVIRKNDATSSLIEKLSAIQARLSESESQEHYFGKKDDAKKDEKDEKEVDESVEDDTKEDKKVKEGTASLIEKLNKIQAKLDEEAKMYPVDKKEDEEDSEEDKEESKKENLNEKDEEVCEDDCQCESCSPKSKKKV